MNKTLANFPIFSLLFPSLAEDAAACPRDLNAALQRKPQPDPSGGRFGGSKAPKHLFNGSNNTEAEEIEGKDATGALHRFMTGFASMLKHGTSVAGNFPPCFFLPVKLRARQALLCACSIHMSVPEHEACPSVAEPLSPCRARSEFTPCPTTRGCRRHLGSSTSCRPEDPRSASSGSTSSGPSASSPRTPTGR